MRAGRSGQSSRAGLIGIAIGALILLGIGIYTALPLLLGTRVSGTVGDCVTHTTYSRSSHTSHTCDVTLSGGGTAQITTDADHSYGEHEDVARWGSRTEEVGEATLMVEIFGGIAVVALALSVWLVLRRRSKAAQMPDTARSST